MNRDDIIRMARQAGFSDVSQLELNVEWTCVASEIEAFAKLVAAAEREECAQIAHDTYEGFGPHAKGVDYVKQSIMIRIRERGAP
jgi:hypothetical protein